MINHYWQLPNDDCAVVGEDMPGGVSYFCLLNYLKSSLNVHTGTSALF